MKLSKLCSIRFLQVDLADTIIHHVKGPKHQELRVWEDDTLLLFWHDRQGRDNSSSLPRLDAHEEALVLAVPHGEVGLGLFPAHRGRGPRAPIDLRAYFVVFFRHLHGVFPADAAPEDALVKRHLGESREEIVRVACEASDCSRITCVQRFVVLPVELVLVRSFKINNLHLESEYHSGEDLVEIESWEALTDAIVHFHLGRGPAIRNDVIDEFHCGRHHLNALYVLSQAFLAALRRREFEEIRERHEV